MLRTPRSVVVYYCIADFKQLTPRVNKLRQSEQATVEASDLVFAQGPELAAHCVQWNSNVHIFPFGVSLDAFPLAENGNGRSSPDGADGRSALTPLQSMPHPIIGYIGGLHRHIDFGLLTAIARARPDWSWVFVGAIQTDVAELADLPNVHLLGQQPHPDLVRYIRSFNVCIVPYVNSLYTATVVPTKINEYLAVGRPVVSTRLPAVCDFNEQHNVLLTSIGQPDDFLQAIEQALNSPTDAAIAARRREVAALGDWQARLEAMSELIEVELQAKAEPAEGKVSS
jgi:glycosyltransferase involved in cell wall biosynthesis